MPDVQVRPFRRGDRDQLTRLVNAHAEAVVPGMSVSVNTVLGSLERQPGEFIVDPWVSERVTLVAEQRSRVAAAAHLLRYYPDDRAGPAYRDAGEIRWLLYWPLAPAGNPFWPNVTGAAEALIAACADVFGRWGVTRRYAGGELLGRDQRLPPVRRARRGGDRLHRDGDPGSGRAAVPARRLGRRRQPACRSRLPASRRGIMAARPGRRLAPAGPGDAPAGLCLAERFRPYRAELRRLPGLPARHGLPRADPHRARVEQGVTAGGAGHRAAAG